MFVIGSRRRSKAQRRITAVLASIPAAREQLLVAIEDLGSSPARFAYAASSTDPRERNKVAVVERVFEELINWIDELAERALAEARRRNLVPRSTGPPYDAPVEQGYAPRDWQTAHAVITAFPRHLDRFLDGYERWLDELELTASRN